MRTSTRFLFCAALLPFLAAPADAQIRFGGFTDIAYYATDDEAAHSNSGFKEGQFVLHLSSGLSERLNFFAEITWSPGGSAFGTEIERSILTYRHTDWLKPSAGRFHTPVSWWNVAFHHGAWLQTSVDRPIPVKFGSKYTPVHFVGAMVDGTVFPGAFSASYTVGLGNGRGEHAERAGDAGDINNHRASLLRISLRHDALYPLQVGGSVYLDEFAATDSTNLDEQMFSAFIIYEHETPEILAEFFHIRHEDPLTDLVTESDSYYAQIAWRLPWWGGLTKPYARIEGMEIADDDAGFSGQVEDLRRALGGLRLDVATKVAVKFEARRYREGSEDYINEFFSSLCLAF